MNFRHPKLHLREHLNFLSISISRLETQLEKNLSVKKKLLKSKLIYATFKNIDEENDYTEISKALRNHQFFKKEETTMYDNYISRYQ